MRDRSASVELTSGRVRGRDGAYLGIPYAAPPVGALRWRAAGARLAWTGELDALAPGPPPPQPIAARSADFAWGPIPPGDEDCLYLNVWTPSSGSAGRGRCSCGRSAAASRSAGRALVSTTERGSPTPPRSSSSASPTGSGRSAGRMATGACSTTSPCSSGCSARSPRSAATLARVTLGGQSAGAAIVADLLVCPAADGLFTRAILHSPPLPEAAGEPERRARWDDALAADRDTPPRTSSRVTRRCSRRGEWRGTRGAALPTLDRRRCRSRRSDAPGARIDVPVLIGSTRDEATFLLRTGGRDGARRTRARPDRAPVHRGPTQQWAGERAAAGGDVHLFRIDHPSPDPRLGALHTIDVPLLFGTFVTSDVARHYVDDDDATRELSAWMQSQWGSFLHGRRLDWTAAELLAIGG